MKGLLFCAVFSLVGTVLMDNHRLQDKKAPELLPPPREIKEVDVTGYYWVDGKDENGKRYDGVVSIRKLDNIYAVQWMVGGSFTTGIGHRHGDYLSVGWKSGVSNLGCTVYKVTDGGKILMGTYVAVPSEGGVMSETLTLLRRPVVIKGDV